jgi:hypothetical protein
MATASAPVDRPDYETTYMLKHGSHCVEYMRQQLMCRPDLATRSPRNWDMERACVDWEEVSRWALKERSNDEVKLYDFSAVKALD